MLPPAELKKQSLHKTENITKKDAVAHKISTAFSLFYIVSLC